MKILYLIPRFTTGGAEKIVLQYAQHFKDAGFEVAVASVIGGGEMVKDFEQAGIKIHVSHNKSWGSWRKLKKFYKKFSPDLVHSHVFSGDMASYLLVSKKTKWISTQHNVEFNTSFLRKVIWKYILQKADKVMAVSENVFNFDNKFFKLNKNKLILNRNGVEVEKWLSVPDNNFVNEKMQIATIGRLEKQKGHVYLIQALGQLKNYDWQWHVYGAGSLEKKLKNLAKKQGIENKVTWHGVVADMAYEYKNINVVVQPSLWEGLSLVTMEAMTAGRVVIGTPWAVETLLENKKTGLIFKEKSVASLVEAINYCFENKASLSAMVLEAKNYAKNNFALKKNILVLEKIYNEILTRY